MSSSKINQEAFNSQFISILRGSGKEFSAKLQSLIPYERTNNMSWNEEADELLNEIKRVRKELEDAEMEEQDAASRVASLIDELEDLQNQYYALLPDDGSDASSGGLDDFE